MFKNINFIKPSINVDEYKDFFVTQTPKTDIVDDYISDNGESSYCKLSIKPLERGYGQTLGNSLRRVLLSSIPGAAVVAISIEGVEHEFCGVDGILEDVTEIILNIKNIVFTINAFKDAEGDFGDEDQLIRLELIQENDKNSKENKEVTANDINYDSSEIISIVNPEQKILTLCPGGKIKMELWLRKGVGYVSQAENKKYCMEGQNPIVGRLPIDSIFTPVTRCRYESERTRHGNSYDYDELTLEVWTNGSIGAVDAVALASKFLENHFRVISNINEFIAEKDFMKIEEEVEEDDTLNTQIIDLNLNNRTYNCLVAAKIRTVADLVSKTEEEMIGVRQLGKKSLKEIKDKLAELNLSFKPGAEDFDIESYGVCGFNEVTIADLDFTARTAKAVNKAGIDTIEKLVSYSEDDLKEATKLGEKAISEIVNKLKGFRLSLRIDNDAE